MTESDLHKRLMRLVKSLWPKEYVMLHRVENGAALGTFDTFAGAPWGSGWIELKIAGPDAKPAMRPGQPGFGYQCWQAGVPAHVLCSSHRGEVKLLRGCVVGEDWRDHMVLRSSLDDKAGMRRVLLACTTPELMRP